MGGIDRLISTQLTKEIKKRMESDILKKVERELFLEHGMSIKLSVEHFNRFTHIFKKNSNQDIKKFENDCVSKIVKIKKKDDRYILTIVDSKLSDLILDSFGDMETRRIITVMLENELTIPQILKESKVPKTSGYRKIENLIINGIIIESGKILSESKKISKLQCIFQEIKIDIKREKISVSGIVSQKLFEKSTSMKSVIESLV